MYSPVGQEVRRTTSQQLAGTGQHHAVGKSGYRKRRQTTIVFAPVKCEFSLVFALWKCEFTVALTLESILSSCSQILDGVCADRWYGTNNDFNKEATTVFNIECRGWSSDLHTNEVRWTREISSTHFWRTLDGKRVPCLWKRRSWSSQTLRSLICFSRTWKNCNKDGEKRSWSNLRMCW